MVSVGSVVAGKVVKVMNYGAFVDLEGGGSGMIHISEVANTYVKDIGDYLKVGDEVTVKVIGINEGGKMSLSIKETMDKGAPRQGQPQGFGHDLHGGGGPDKGAGPAAGTGVLLSPRQLLLTDLPSLISGAVHPQLL